MVNTLPVLCFPSAGNLTSEHLYYHDWTCLALEILICLIFFMLQEFKRLFTLNGHQMYYLTCPIGICIYFLYLYINRISFFYVFKKNRFSLMEMPVRFWLTDGVRRQSGWCLMPLVTDEKTFCFLTVFFHSLEKVSGS